MTILVEKPELVSQVDSQNLVEKTKELVLDGGFPVPKSLSGDEFLAPETNSFGNSFRDYNAESERQKSVEEFYRQQHINQTFDFVQKTREEYSKLDRMEMSIWECCELLNEVVDDSDPDLDEPQIQHLLQSAEAIRKDYPNEDWLHLTALIHDLGKVLLLPKFGGLPQWAVVGDTFPLGCAFDEANIHHKYFKENPDYNNPAYNTKNGIYSDICGLDNVTISWGHDDYMYLVAKENGTTLPSAGLFIIRYHSLYPLHKEEAYMQFLNDEDMENLKWLRIFNSLRADGESFGEVFRKRDRSAISNIGPGGGSGGTILLFFHSIMLADSSVISTAGGHGSPSGAGGGGVVRVHFHCSDILTGDVYQPIASVRGSINTRGGFGRG